MAMGPIFAKVQQNWGLFCWRVKLGLLFDYGFDGKLDCGFDCVVEWTSDLMLGYSLAMKLTG